MFFAWRSLAPLRLNTTWPRVCCTSIKSALRLENNNNNQNWLTVLQSLFDLWLTSRFTALGSFVMSHSKHWINTFLQHVSYCLSPIIQLPNCPFILIFISSYRHLNQKLVTSFYVFAAFRFWEPDLQNRGLNHPGALPDPHHSSWYAH